MNESNTKRLFREFPNLYAGGKLSFGFEHGDGWFDIVHRLSQHLERLIIDYKRNCKEDPMPPHAVQVKEKYGTLRFYMSHLTEDMQSYIEEAEQRCHRTCETCGRSGKLRKENGWLQTLCEEHNKN